MVGWSIASPRGRGGSGRGAYGWALPPPLAGTTCTWCLTSGVAPAGALPLAWAAMPEPARVPMLMMVAMAMVMRLLVIAVRMLKTPLGKLNVVRAVGAA